MKFKESWSENGETLDKDHKAAPEYKANCMFTVYDGVTGTQ
jgi:hypothetical protein